MTIAQTLKTISLLSAVTPHLLFRLAERSQMAMEPNNGNGVRCHWERKPHCSGLEIPPCQLAEAGIAHCRAGVDLERGAEVTVAGQRRNPPRMCSSTMLKTMMFRDHAERIPGVRM